MRPDRLVFLSRPRQPTPEGELRACCWTTVTTTFGSEVVWRHAPNCACPPDDQDTGQ